MLLVQISQGGLVGILRLFLHPLGDLFFHIRDVGIAEITFGDQRFAGGVDHRAAHQDGCGKQDNCGFLHGASEII